MTENTEKQPVFTKKNLAKAGTFLLGIGATLVSAYSASQRPASTWASLFGIMEEPRDNYFTDSRRRSELEAQQKQRKMDHEHEERMLKLRIEAKEKGIDLEEPKEK